MLGRLRVIKIMDLEELIILMAMVLSQLQSKKMIFDLRLIVIDSLSALFNAVPAKPAQYFSLIKELLFYFKSLTKKHFISVLYTNNTKDSAVVHRVTEVKTIVGEPLNWAVDK